jgi:acetyl esterase
MDLDYSNIDAEVLAGLRLMPAGLDDLTRDTVVNVRAMRAQAAPQPLETKLTIDQRWLTADHGDVRVVIYGPPDSEVRPGLLWVHGGGYVLGTAEDDRARVFAEELGCRVVSVDYRLAPEHPFPAGIDDCYASLVWMVEHATELAIDPARIAVGGQSGGGGMAAGLVLLNRDRGGPELVHQLLIYPMIDNVHDTLSGSYVNHPVWNRATSLRAWEMYLDSTPGLDASPYAAATRADDVASLPPTFICVGTEDLFRDENVDYARRLINAGVPTELAVFPGMYHGGDMFVPDALVSRRLTASFMQALSDAFVQPRRDL